VIPAARLIAALGLTAALGLFDLVARPVEVHAQAMMLPVDATPLVIRTQSGEKRFDIEIADEAVERSAGLMFRQQLPDNRGMLFVMDGEGRAGFWMKNTPLPLDLLFIGADGRVRAILKGEPESEALISPEAPVSYVLELKAGTAAGNGIAEGDLLVHPAIAAAPDAG
jgi:uncharacterized protein